MDFDSILKHRQMVRNYQERVVEESKLQRILEVAQRGPSAGHAQGTSLVVVESAGTRQAIAQLAREENWVAKGYEPWLSRAPVHLILCVEPEEYHRRYAESDKQQAISSRQWPVPYWFVDGGCSLMLILLSAVEQGLAAGFQGAQNLPGLAQLLKIPPQVLPLGVVTLGYAANPRPGSSIQRKRRQQRVHREVWHSSSP